MELKISDIEQMCHTMIDQIENIKLELDPSTKDPTHVKIIDDCLWSPLECRVYDIEQKCHELINHIEKFYKTKSC